MKKITFIFILLYGLTSCKKDKPAAAEDTVTNNDVVVKFENFVGPDALQLNVKDYVNQHGDLFRVSLFNYYISNVQLKASDNSVYSESESYHLVKASEGNTLQFTLKNVPLKNYNSISFVLGVDSARNVSGAQTGDLDPLKNMFWDWNSGYIMAKFEGTSPKSPSVGNLLLYHVGGFSGANNVLKKMNISFPNEAQVTASIIPKITMKADLLEWFKTPAVIDFQMTHTIHMPGAMAKKVADNYADMFSVSKVEN